MYLKSIPSIDPKVSIIIPTYNRIRPLKRAIKSALRQTFDDYEIIVIDDASEYSPETMLENLKDDRISFLKHETNKGGGAARNTGIKGSTGKYVAFLDSDDEWLPNKLSCQVTRLESTPNSNGAHYTGLNVFSHDKKLIYQRRPTLSGDISKDIFKENLIGPLSSFIVKRSAFDRCGYFDENLPSCQDWDLFIRIAQKYEILSTSEVMVNYYLGKNSITGNPLAKAIGHQMITKKYFEKIKLNKKYYSKQLATIGHYFCRSGMVNEGRKEFLKAIHNCPSIMSTYLLLFCSLLGFNSYMHFLHIRHRLQNGLDLI